MRLPASWLFGVAVSMFELGFRQTTYQSSMALDLRGICPLLQVFDMPNSLAFYRDLVGFEVIQTAPPADKVLGDQFGWAWLRHGTTELMLSTAHDPEDVRPPTPDLARVMAHDDTILFIGSPDVDAAHRYLRALGVNLAAPVVTQYGMKQLHLKDLDGFGLCFQRLANA